jgi:hypothetical protein
MKKIVKIDNYRSGRRNEVFLSKYTTNLVKGCYIERERKGINKPKWIFYCGM